MFPYVAPAAEVVSTTCVAAPADTVTFWVTGVSAPDEYVMT